jgi:hypothetical protein
MLAFDNNIIGISKLTVYMCFLGLVCKRYHVKKDTFPIYYGIFPSTLQNVFRVLGVVSSYFILWCRELGDTFKMESGCVLVQEAFFVRFGTLSLWSKCHTVKTNGYDGKGLLLGLAFTWVYKQSSLDLMVHNSG